jgi:branched-chain amino acid transport system ATP-binding protein
MLELVNVTKHFGGVHALDGVSLTVKKGKITALIGPNGSGKSTLFNVVCGVLPLDSGKVFFNKKEISSFNIEQISNLGV